MNNYELSLVAGRYKQSKLLFQNVLAHLHVQGKELRYPVEYWIRTTRMLLGQLPVELLWAGPTGSKSRTRWRDNISFLAREHQGSPKNSWRRMLGRKGPAATMTRTGISREK